MTNRNDRYAEREWRATDHTTTPRSTWNRPKPKAKRPSALARLFKALT